MCVSNKVKVKLFIWCQEDKWETIQIVRMSQQIDFPNLHENEMSAHYSNAPCLSSFKRLTTNHENSFYFSSFASDTAWQFKHNYFYLDPLQGTFEVSNLKFMFSDGIFSITLSDVKNNGWKTAYFHSSCRYRIRISFVFVLFR